MNFESVGIESTLLIMNIGPVFWITCGYLSFLLVILFCIKVKYIREKFAKKVFYNGIIRFIMSMFQDYVLLCILNLATADFDTVYADERYSNTLSIVLLAIFLIMSLTIILITCVKRASWTENSFLERFGEQLDSLDVHKE